MKGEVLSYGIYPDGRRELIEEGENLVVSNAYVVMAMVMKQDPSFEGFMYWALGNGDGSSTADWDDGVEDGSISPSEGDTQLDNEIYRKAIQPSDIVFIDGQNKVVAGPTNRLQITVNFAEDEPYASQSAFLREWGLFGGDATSTADSGFLINRKVHRTYEKTQFAQLERVLRFTF